MKFCAILAVITWPLVIGQQNLLRNPSFENAIVSSDWKSNGGVMQRITTDVLDGTYAIKCTGRDNVIEGILQPTLNITKSKTYGFQGYVKLLNHPPGKLWQEIKVILQMNVTEVGTTMTYLIAHRSFCTKEQGWILLKGDVESPEKDFINPILAIRGMDTGVDFLADNLSLSLIEENPNWRAEADTNIEQYRKSNVVLDVQVPEGVPASQVDIQIKHVDHDFAFGSLIRDSVETSNNELMKRYFSLFNWGTVQSYKWKFNKGNPPDTNPNFSSAIQTTDLLNSMGMKVRGHCIFWNVEKNIPDWVKALPEEDTLSCLHEHLEYMVNLASGKLVQWDIQNEHIVQHYFEEKLSDPTVTKGLYSHAKALGDSAKLYMNEYDVGISGARTEQYHDLAMEFLNEGIPVEGLGIQGHTNRYTRPNPTSMWRRLQRLGSTGLNMMITEFDIQWFDKVTRADWLEDSIRAFFGCPLLTGVVLWGFWNQTMSDPDKALVEGADLNIVEPGQRWACLVKKEWTTKETFNLGQGTLRSLRGFQGAYEVLVTRNGIPVQRENFTLGKLNTTWNLSVTNSTDGITITPEVDYVPQCISHRAERSLATATTTSKSSSLTCRTAFSPISGTAENAAVSASCDKDEVLTGCSSFHINKTWTRKGEKIEVDPVTGEVKCAAFNGRNSPGGVQAEARCCRRKGLTCDYRTAGPSFSFDGAMAEVRCAAGQLALGCASYSEYPDMDGVKPSNYINSCIAQSGAPAFTNPAEKSGLRVPATISKYGGAGLASGSLAYAACCSASVALHCMVLVSNETPLVAGSQQFVVCPSGYVVTGCNAFAEDGKTAGAGIYLSQGLEKCRGFLGSNLPPGSTGVKVYATCCTV